MKASPCILWIQLDHFYAERSANPVVVIRDDMVLDVNPEAQARSVQRGLSLRQARAILPDAVYVTWKADDYEAKRKAWLDLCVDFSGVIEPDDQDTAWLDLSLHPKPIDVAEKLIRVLAQETGLKVRYGAGPSTWVSYLAAKHGDCGLAMRDVKAFLASLSVSELLPVQPQHRERLRYLGYRTIGSVAELSLATLQGQFGQSALTVHSASHGRLAQRPLACYPYLSIAESIVFDGAVETTEAVFEAYKVLAQSVGDRLSGRGVQSGRLQASLEYEDETSKFLSRTFTKPLRCPRSVFSALRLLLEPALTGPIQAIRLSIPDLEKVNLVQPSLVNCLSNKDHDRISDALKQVQHVFGSGAVRLGKEIETPRRVRVLREWKHATGWR